jgi:hypothetical protein
LRVDLKRRRKPTKPGGELVVDIARPLSELGCALLELGEWRVKSVDDSVCYTQEFDKPADKVKLCASFDCIHWSAIQLFD